MPIIGFPFDNVQYDASALGAWLCTRTRGVFAADGHYTVAIDGDLSVSVSSGVAWLQMGAQWGVVAPNAASVSLPVAAGDGSLNRIDAVCLRINKNTSAIELLIKQGELAASPVIPAIERDLDYDEIYLATISVPAGATELTAAQLTDQRMNEEYCGVMRDGVTGIPTEALWAQVEATLDGVRSDTAATIALIEDELSRLNAGTEVMLKTEYAPDATAAMTNGVLTVVSTYQHTGTDYDVKFVAPDGFESAETFVLDGDTVTVRGADMEPGSLEAAPEAVVNLSRHGSDVFPKSGGGGFNLRVFGGSSRPASPKEGDIWMPNAVIVGKPWYGVNPPASPVQGQVLVLCDDSSTYGVQAAQNALIPVGTPQWYDTGSWEMPDSEIYSGGAWHKLGLYLFKSSFGFNKLYEALMGAANMFAYTDDSFKILYRQSGSPGLVYFSDGSSLSNGVDITQFTKLCFDCETTQSVGTSIRVGFYATKPNSPSTYWTGFEAAGAMYQTLAIPMGRKVITLDISGRSGVVFPGVGAYGNIEVFNVWLE